MAMDQIPPALDLHRQKMEKHRKKYEKIDKIRRFLTHPQTILKFRFRHSAAFCSILQQNPPSNRDFQSQWFSSPDVHIMSTVIPATGGAAKSLMRTSHAEFTQKIDSQLPKFSVQKTPNAPRAIKGDINNSI